MSALATSKVECLYVWVMGNNDATIANATRAVHSGLEQRGATIDSRFVARQDCDDPVRKMDDVLVVLSAGAMNPSELPAQGERFDAYFAVVPERIGQSPVTVIWVDPPQSVQQVFGEVQGRYEVTDDLFDVAAHESLTRVGLYNVSVEFFCDSAVDSEGAGDRESGFTILSVELAA